MSQSEASTAAMIIITGIQESKQLLHLCNKGSFEEVTLLLKSRDKGAAINATFEEIYVCAIAINIYYMTCICKTMK